MYYLKVITFSPKSVTMKKMILTLLAAGVCGYSSFAQEMDQAAMMKAWEAYMTPGAVHKMMAKASGNWTNEITSYMEGQSTVSKGSAVVKMILGGRYQQSEYKSTMMGQPFQGMSLLGYDNKTQEFTSVWVDNMGTGIMTLKGKWDEASRSVTFTGTMVDAMSGQDMPVREVVGWPDADHETMVMYQTINGVETKMMEMKSARVKTPQKK